MLIGAVAVVVVLALVATAVLFGLPGRPGLLTGEPAAVETPRPVVVTVTARPPAGEQSIPPPPPPVTEPSEPPPPTQPADPEKAAKQQLDAAVSDDASLVDSLQGVWTSVLSTKRKDVKWEGKKWTYQMILAEYEDFLDEYPDVLILNPHKYASTKLASGWYMTISGQWYDTPDEALSWCAYNGYSDDDCFAIKLTQSTSGKSTAHRK